MAHPLIRRSLLFVCILSSHFYTFPTQGSPIIGPGPASHVTCGGSHSCVIKPDKTVQCWGNDSQGQLGNGGSNTTQTHPTYVPGLTNVVALSAGGSHTCAITEDHKVWCWGDNAQGQLGDATFVDKTSPVWIFAPVSQISAGRYHNCGVGPGGTVWCWGDNAYGQLGHGVGPDDSVPSQVWDLAGVTQVSSGGNHTCALQPYMEGGSPHTSVWCWGRNDYGQLGDGTTIDRPFPYSTVGIDNVVSISAGGSHTCAVKNDGKMWCWGKGDLGQLGDIDYSPPTAWTSTPLPSFGNGITAVATGDSHTCVLDSDHTVWCAGSYADGRRGTVDHPSYYDNYPFPVDLAGVLEISTTRKHDCVVRYFGQVDCWGDNAYGQIGDGSFLDQWGPVLVDF